MTGISLICCRSFFGHPCLCLLIPSFQGLGGTFTHWILVMPGAPAQGWLWHSIYFRCGPNTHIAVPEDWGRGARWGPRQRPLQNRIHGMSRGVSQNKPKVEHWRLRRGRTRYEQIFVNSFFIERWSTTRLEGTI